MTTERREQIVTAVLDRWLARPKRLRNLSLTGLVLCGGIAVILGGVLVSGHGSGDVAVPAVIAAGLGLVCALGFFRGRAQIGRLREHSLLAALRATPPQIASVEPITVRTRDGLWHALEIRGQNGASATLYLDDGMRRDLLAWLSPGRAS